MSKHLSILPLFEFPKCVVQDAEIGIDMNVKATNRLIHYGL